MTCTGFVVLPDVSGIEPVYAAVPFMAQQKLTHSSGRPWVIGCWLAGEVLLATTDSVRVAVIGFCPITAARLSQLISQVRVLSDIDALAQVLPGSFHLIASIGPQTRVQGSLMGLRRVFHSRIREVPIASDSVEVLAAMTGATIDDQGLAVRVVCGGMVPPPLGERSMWTGITALPQDNYVVLESSRTREVQWWQPPTPHESLDRGSEMLRDALITAVADRNTGTGRLSADMSGGIDSTSLCFLAATNTPRLIAFRWGAADGGNDDEFFATHAARHLPQAEHLIVPHDQLPDVFAEPGAFVDIEQPYPFTRTISRIRYTAELLAANGSELHIAGHGADEQFSKLPGYLFGLLRRRPLTGVRHVRGHIALNHWATGAVAAHLISPDDVATWWRNQADGLVKPSRSRRYSSLGWSVVPLRAPDWVTGEALAAARDELYSTAECACPLAEDRGQHQFMAALRTTAPAYRQLALLYLSSNVQLHLPYLDDRVVEATLNVRLYERASPWRYKPLLAEAMRNIVPDAVLGRSTKGEYSKDTYIGWQRNQSAILEYLGDSALAAYGLIDTDVLRATLLAPQADNARYIALENLLGCEAWFRAAQQAVSLRRGSCSCNPV